MTRRQKSEKYASGKKKLYLQIKLKFHIFKKKVLNTEKTEVSPETSMNVLFHEAI